MKTLTTLTALSAAFLITAAIGPARAGDGDMTQTHLNLQASDADFAESLDREQNRTMNQNQNQYQYKYMNDASAERGAAGGDSVMSRSMDRYNTMDRYSQNSAMSGSMNRQSSTTRSMGGGRR